ncbi:MAG TPA: nickel pincer cofactor biosynthesis protein LarC [Jatrophihabitans sp.]
MIAVVDPFTGLAGDMFLAALLDAGASLDAVRASIVDTGLTGWTLRADALIDHGLRASRLQVDVTDTASERPAGELIALAGRATPQPVADAAVAVLTALAETEAALHGTDVATVHLHELGGHDTLIDVAGVCAALHHLDVHEIFVASPLPMGRGTVTTRHGVLPVPAPATAALLAGAQTVGSDLPGETVTPTGAALLAGLRARWDPAPAMRLERTGYGAGARRLADRPNVVAVRLGRPVGSDTDDSGDTAEPLFAEALVELATTVDDVSGEIVGHLLERALAAGALDAWVMPAVMKKSRPGQVVHVLTRPADAARLRLLVVAETGSLGVRSYPVTRHAAIRSMITVHVDGHAVRVKVGPFGAKPEHDDVVRAADALGIPIREVAHRTMKEVPP